MVVTRDIESYKVPGSLSDYGWSSLTVSAYILNFSSELRIVYFRS